MDRTLYNYFIELDKSLGRLGHADSSIEYASHIRDEFDNVISNLNQIKQHLDLSTELQFSSDEYFS